MNSWGCVVSSHVEAPFLGDLDYSGFTPPPSGDMVGSVIWGSLHHYWVSGKTDLEPEAWMHNRVWADAPALCRRARCHGCVARARGYSCSRTFQILVGHTWESQPGGKFVGNEWDAGSESPLHPGLPRGWRTSLAPSVALHRWKAQLISLDIG